MKFKSDRRALGEFDFLRRAPKFGGLASNFTHFGKFLPKVS